MEKNGEEEEEEEKKAGLTDISLGTAPRRTHISSFEIGRMLVPQLCLRPSPDRTKCMPLQQPNAAHRMPVVLGAVGVRISSGSCEGRETAMTTVDDESCNCRQKLPLDNRQLILKNHLQITGVTINESP